MLESAKETATACWTFRADDIQGQIVQKADPGKRLPARFCQDVLTSSPNLALALYSNDQCVAESSPPSVGLEQRCRPETTPFATDPEVWSPQAGEITRVDVRECDNARSLGAIA